MVKRSKRLKNAIESYKEEIEKHFKKLENDINEKDDILAKYHIKEIDKSLIAALEHKISLLGANAEDIELIKRYRSLLEEYKKKLGIE
jgi:uncharacterized secreted protein with C-terminal beta-propeller domain